MRDVELIDFGLRLLAAVRWSIRQHGGEPSSRQIDELLDERLAQRAWLHATGMSVPVFTVQLMTTPADCRPEHNSKPEPWSKRTYQVWARYGGNDGRFVFFPDGAADHPFPFEPSRTFRDLATSGQLWCPVENCEAFQTVGQGDRTRSHFRHRAGSKKDDALHRSGPESLWHVQAKCAIYEWISAVTPASALRILELEFKEMPRLRNGTERRQPDVYVEFRGGVRVAFECQRQSMGGTSRENSATHHDGRAEWRRRLDDCRELRDEHAIHVIWIVSPWMSKGTPRLTRGNVWELNCFGTWAAGMLAAGAQLYWLDPNFGQIGTLVDHIGRNNDGPGFLTAAREFPNRYKHHWLHSDGLMDCEIDPHTGAVTTSTDREVERDRLFAERRRRIQADREAEKQQELQKIRDETAAQTRAAQEKRERDWQARQQAKEKYWLQVAARRAQAAAEARQVREAEAAKRRAIAIASAFAAAVLVVFLWWLLSPDPDAKPTCSTDRSWQTDRC